MGKCCPGTHETFTHDGYMSPMMGICRHGYMSHGYMSPNQIEGGLPLRPYAWLKEARENVLGAYQQLRDTHPAFPEVLRDFQVIKSTTTPTACTLLPLQADIVAAAINVEDGHHILSSLQLMSCKY